MINLNVKLVKFLCNEGGINLIYSLYERDGRYTTELAKKLFPNSNKHQGLGNFAHYLRIAKELGLIKSYGQDYHRKKNFLTPKGKGLVKNLQQFEKDSYELERAFKN